MAGIHKIVLELDDDDFEIIQDAITEEQLYRRSTDPDKKYLNLRGYGQAGNVAGRMVAAICQTHLCNKLYSGQLLMRRSSSESE